MESRCPGGEKMEYLAGIDIGGTKCSVSLGRAQEGQVELLCREKFPTPGTPREAVERMKDSLGRLLSSAPQNRLSAVGVSCGGPLSSERGLILSPPNLPGWDGIDILTPFEKAFGVPAFLENDANACALAEWQFGAGMGTQNMIFLTFGTGFGAGLILGGRLYGGSCGLAGEIGHVRAEQTGPVGYGKEGSYEGFCSGGGIARFARDAIEKQLFHESPRQLLAASEEINAKEICRLADKGDPFCLHIINVCDAKLGQCLAMLIDLLNPDAIVIGSIYERNIDLFLPTIEQTIAQEALPASAARCRILPSALGDGIGDYAAAAVGYMGLGNGQVLGNNQDLAGSENHIRD